MINSQPIKKNTSPGYQSGFTLIEIIVSLGIFAVVAVIAVGALVRVTSANRQAQAIQSGVNNVSFILDAISREMRVGTGYKCSWSDSSMLDSNNLIITGATCDLNAVYESPKDTLISFTSSNTDGTSNLIYSYLFHTVTNGSTQKIVIYKGEETATIKGSNVVFNPVTSESVNITDYKAGIFGGNTSYPYGLAFIRIAGYAGIKIKDQSVFDVQTTISQRAQ
ncbi:MAG: prepilin-type N-terminal cleavage/methylation domain-containing protein [Candidatus Pacebacteria bacterium]|nr:prepilin-type N-terminal cleavage/methylation domain-containing protein [Candidatus Paceibacterota bacterium]